MAKKSISVTLEESTIESLRRIADDEMRSVSNLIDYIVFQYSKSLASAPSSKIGRAAAFGNSVSIADFKETENYLIKNVSFDDDDRVFLNNLGAEV